MQSGDPGRHDAHRAIHMIGAGVWVVCGPDAVIDTLDEIARVAIETATEGHAAKPIQREVGPEKHVEDAEPQDTIVPSHRPFTPSVFVDGALRRLHRSMQS